MPKAMATMEIRIIGFEKEFFSPFIIFFAKNSSKFNELMGFV